MLRTLQAVTLALATTGPGAWAQTPITPADRRTADSLRTAGLTAYRAGDFARAAEAFQRQAELSGDPTALFNVGAMRARLGQRDSAFAWLERAAAAGFRGLQLLREDADLETLRGDPRLDAVIATVERTVTPCAFRPEARQFDFWIGQWEVRSVQDQVVGHSRVEVVSGQCALLENWTDGFGGSGKSLNAYNTARNQWQQFWVGQGGAVTEYRDSHWAGASLVFIAAAQADAKDQQRMTFTPLPNGRVRQLGETTRDGGTTWTVQYDLTYYPVPR
jgi:hypothetical protein